MIRRTPTRQAPAHRTRARTPARRTSIRRAPIRQAPIRRAVAGLLTVLVATGLAVLGFASPAAAHDCGSLTDCLPSGRSLLMALAAVLIVVGIVVLFSAFPPAGGAALALAGGGVAGSAGAISLSTVAAGTATVTAGIALAAAADGMPTGGSGSGGSGGSGGSPPDPARSMNIETSQLQHAFKHAKDFGITGNWNKAAGEAFRHAIQNHIGNAQTQIIQGTYRGEAVTHFYNPNTGLNVIRSQGGDFVSGWKLSPQQVQHLLRSGSLGGG